jgi:PAS domain S-box-containing protein
MSIVIVNRGGGDRPAEHSDGETVLTRKVQLAFGSAILTLLVVGAVSYRGTVVSRESDRWVRHTHEVIENLQDLLLAMEGIESSYRGFALTGKESYLESYHAGILSAEQYEATVRNLTLDNPTQQQRLPVLERLAAQKIQFADMVINLRRAKGLEAAAHAIEGGLGQRSMDEFQGIVRELQDEELRLLVLRNGDVKRRLGQTKTTLILGTILGLLIAAVAGWSVQRESSRRGLAEKHSAQMEGRYRGLLEAAPDAMVVVNQGGEIVLLNVQAEKQFGYSRDELVGQKVKNIIPEGFAERLIADGTRSAAEELVQQMGTGIELSGRRRDGSEFPIEIMLSPLQSTEGVLVTAAIRDITERKKSEEHLVKAVGSLKRSNDELQQFAYVSSHDLQEPLRMVASYTQLLARRYKGRLDSDADEFIAFAVDGCNRMQGLIQDLLAFSRAGTNGKALRKISGDDALKEALTNLRITIGESGAVVTQDSLPVIQTDDTQLTQVFQNLVGNAIKYRSAEVPRVHVSATKNGGHEWIFSVRDNGLGIDPQYFERIFILFQRLHGRNEFEGTGIGLAICKKIVERLGGRIWVESLPKKGSTFYFALPEGNNK